MNFKKFLKWSLVLMAILAYKQMEASDDRDDHTGKADRAVTRTAS